MFVTVHFVLIQLFTVPTSLNCEARGVSIKTFYSRCVHVEHERKINNIWAGMEEFKQ